MLSMKLTTAGILMAFVITASQIGEHEEISETSVLVGDDVILKCGDNSSDLSRRFWKKDEILIVGNNDINGVDRISLVNSSAILRIMKAEVGDKGYYKCIVYTQPRFIHMVKLQVTEMLCDSPVQPVGGAYVSEAHGPKYKTGDTIIYNCYRGHRLIGQSIRICTGSGSTKGWDTDEPYCEPEYIGHLMRKLDGIEQRIATVENKTLKMENQISAMDTKISAMDTKISAMDTKISAMDNNISAMDNNISAMDNNISAMDKDILAMNQVISAMDKNISTIRYNVSTIDDSMLTMVKSISSMDKKWSHVDNSMTVSNHTMAVIDKRISSVDEKLSHMDNSLSVSNHTMAEMDKRISSVDEKWSRMDNSMSVSNHNMLVMDNRMSEVETTLSATNSILLVMNNRFANIESRLSSVDVNISSLESFDRPLTKIRERLVVCVNHSNAIEQDILSKCLTMELGIKDGLSVSVYTWVIENFNSKVTSTRWSPHYSPVFYHTVPGYKFKLRGDIDSDTEIRMFLYLVPGEYDDQMKWPFSKKYDLTVLKNDGTEVLYKNFSGQQSTCKLTRPNSATEFSCFTTGTGWSEVWRNKKHILKDGSTVIKIYMYN